MKTWFPRSSICEFIWAAMFAFFPSCTQAQPAYFHLNAVGYCGWQTSNAPISANILGTNLFTVDEGGGLVSVAVSDPSHPLPLARWDSGGIVSDLALAGTRACLAAGTQGVHIVEAADPTSLTRLGTYLPGGFVFALDGAGDRIYVAWQTPPTVGLNPGVQVDIVDLTDPVRPARIGLI